MHPLFWSGCDTQRQYGAAVRGLLVFVLLCALSGCQNLGAPETLEELLSACDRTVPSMLARTHVPGAAVVFLEGGEIVASRGYGLADTVASTPIDPAETLFQVASISKSIAAWAMLALVQQERVSLDEPIDRYLTRWHLPDTFHDETGVTVLRLLSHTAGTNVSGYPGYPPEADLPTIEESLRGHGNTLPVMLLWEPGSGFHYSGGGYTILQLLIEEVSGDAFSTFARDTVLVPLGMTRSGFDYDGAVQQTVARAHDWLGRELPNYLFTARAAAGLYTTAEDLARFVAAHMNVPGVTGCGGGVLSPETVTLAHTPVAEMDDGSQYGLGCVVETLANASTVISHSGDNRGWVALYACVPDTGAGLVVLTNGDAGGSVCDEIRRAWESLYDR